MTQWWVHTPVALHPFWWRCVGGAASVVVALMVCRRCRRRTSVVCPDLPGGSKGSLGAQLPVLRFSTAGHTWWCAGVRPRSGHHSRLLLLLLLLLLLSLLLEGGDIPSACAPVRK